MKTVKSSKNKDLVQDDNNKTNIKVHFIIGAITLLFLLISCSTSINVTLSIDPPVYLNVARNILNGKILYTEIVDNKGPVLYFMNALFLKIGGQYGIALLEFLLIYFFLLYSYKTIKLLNDNKKHQLLVLILISTYLLRFFNYGLSCEEYALCFSSVGLYECVKYYKNSKFSNGQCILIGILCALCFFIRQNLVVVFAGFGLGIGIKLLIEKKFKELFKYILFSLIGFMIVTLPILAYLLINHCFNDYIYFTFTINMNTNKLGFIKCIKSMFQQIPGTLFCMFLYSLYIIKKLIVNKDINYLSDLFLILITILFNTLGVLVSIHYFIIFIPALLVVFSRFLQIIPKSNFYKMHRIVSYIFIITIIFANISLSMDNLYLPLRHKKMINYIKNNTTKDDKLAIIGFMDEVYYLSERDSASRFTYVIGGLFYNEIQQKMLNELLDTIYNDKPTIIIIDDISMLFGVMPYMNTDELYHFIEDNYKEVFKEHPIVTKNNQLIEGFDSIRVYKLKNAEDINNEDSKK